MNTPYWRAFERIHARYMDRPGTRLTPPQAERLSEVDSSVCSLVLDDLVEVKWLRLGTDGSYVRLRTMRRPGARTRVATRGARSVI